MIFNQEEMVELCNKLGIEVTKRNISLTEKDIETIFKEQENLSPNQLSLKDLSDEFEMYCLNTGGACESHCTEVCIGCVLTWIFKNYNLIKRSDLDE